MKLNSDSNLENVLSSEMFKFALIVNHLALMDDLNQDVNSMSKNNEMRHLDLTYPPFNLKDMELVYQFNENKDDLSLIELNEERGISEVTNT